MRHPATGKLRRFHWGIDQPSGRLDSVLYPLVWVVGIGMDFGHGAFSRRPGRTLPRLSGAVLVCCLGHQSLGHRIVVRAAVRRFSAGMEAGGAADLRRLDLDAGQDQQRVALLPACNRRAIRAIARSELRAGGAGCGNRAQFQSSKDSPSSSRVRSSSSRRLWMSSSSKLWQAYCRTERAAVTRLAGEAS